MKMQQKDQENGATPKKHWKAVTQGTGVNNCNVSSPSVASRSAAFQANAAKDQQKVIHYYNHEHKYACLLMAFKTYLGNILNFVRLNILSTYNMGGKIYL